MKYTTKIVPSYHVQFNGRDYSFWGESVSLLQDVKYAKMGASQVFDDEANRKEESIFETFCGFKYKVRAYTVLRQKEGGKPVFFKFSWGSLDETDNIKQAFEFDGGTKYVYTIDEHGRWTQYEKGDSTFRVECQINKIELDLLFRSLRNTVTQLHNNKEQILKSGYGEDSESFQDYDMEIKQVKEIMSKITYTEE